MNQHVILIFTKVPLPGFVKTRLTQNSKISKKDAALIAEAMLKDSISLASKSNTDRIEIGYFPKDKLSILKNIVESVRIDGNLAGSVSYYPQKGSNFDERFGSVVASSFENGAVNIIILGADLPFLDSKLLDLTFNYLSSKKNKNNLVIGPASGGGIYLVGINKSFDFHWFKSYHLFRGGIEISQFVNLCKNEQIPLILLPPYGDIDLEEDLVSLITYIEALKISHHYKGFHFPEYTANILKKLGLYINELKSGTRNRKIAKKL